MDRLLRRDVFGLAGCPAAAERRQVQGQVAEHSHDFLEVVLVLAGSGRHLGPEGATALRPGMLLAVRPGQWHGYADCRDADLVNLYLGPELCRRELRWILDFPDLARFVLGGGSSPVPLGVDATAALLGWLAALAVRADAVGTPGAAVSLGLVSCALGEMAGAFPAPVDGRRSISPLVRRALTMMSEHPEAAWSMPVLAERLAVSVAHLHRRFRVEMGIAPMAWLARTRVELAASLLISGEGSVAEVGRTVGWPDPSHFSRRFRELTGTSPREHRLRAGSAGPAPGEHRP